MDKRPLTFATGSRACGKSTMMELLCRLAHDTSVLCCIDTSDIIRKHIQKQTKIGISLSAHRDHMIAGKVIPAHDLIVEAVLLAAQQLWSECRTHQVLVSGTPRHIEQSKRIKESGHPIRVFHIVQEKKDVADGIKMRQLETGSTRHDETSEAIENSWTEYEKIIIPALDPLNGHVLELKRSRPMRERLEQAIGHMLLPDHVRAKMLRRLNTRDHPVSEEVDVMDGTEHCSHRHTRQLMTA